MAYKVITTPRAEQQLQEALNYLVFHPYFCNQKAASDLLKDFLEVVDKLEQMAESFKKCEEPNLLNYRKARLKHSYCVLYTVTGNVVYIEHFYHFKQDYTRLLINY